MKNLLIAFSLLIIVSSCKPKSSKSEEITKPLTSNHQEAIKLFQNKLNTQYASTKESPLTEEDLKIFKALDFFDIDENFRVEASLDLTPDSPIFEMQTTTERKPLYKKYGIARFSLNGKECELSLYQSLDLMTTADYADYLFLPFNDASNGETSYGGGRFIDLEIPEAGSKTIVIDFNESYNPYCAYNHKYSCPVPPSENNLNIQILAGVKAYKEHH